MNLSKTQRALALALVIAAGGAGLAAAQTNPVEPLVLSDVPGLAGVVAAVAPPAQ
ncbi:hypothetical protein [Phenylobacterium aquaticum]|uniref:hypothetical protein n=1 Tax=Phenylobacterium aquaticum TaxID=1763816 RepID=UPI0026EC7C84|nr:hypothetical protein [Phenylobacterium aquaticum]